MLILILFAFLGGIVTILSPCILPILPIVLSGSVTGGKRRPLGVVTGFIASFTVFTLFLSAIVRGTGVSPDALRLISVMVIAVFGLSLLIPGFSTFTERLFSRIISFVPRQNTQDGYGAGILVGVSLGLLWTPCVGPILASVITLAATNSVGLGAIIITLSYAIGTALPLLAVTIGGRTLLTSHPWLITHTSAIQKGFGILMLLTALAIYNSWDRTFQTYILGKFPSYGIGLTKLEDNTLVQKQLNELKKGGSRMNTMFQSNYGNAPDFNAGGQWFNTDPLSIKELRGKVVLVDFWTYTCINCIRTLPYIKTWNEKYKDKGLVIVGVHTPEFEFEKNPDNVKKALLDFGITYAVVQDNNYATWQAYANHYWPAKYMVDKEGKIRYTHFGEGDYDETEKMIQTLLSENGPAVEDEITNPTYLVQAKTPETYLGYERMAGLVSPERVTPNTPMTFSLPKTINDKTFALTGTWTIGAERAMPQKGATLVYRFDAGEVFLVMRPKSDNLKAAIRITMDKKSPEEFAGEDVHSGVISVESDRLYKLIKLPVAGPGVMRLEFLDDNVELYAFTFG